MNKYKKALIESVDRKDKENYKNLKELVDRATPLKPKKEVIECYFRKKPAKKTSINVLNAIILLEMSIIMKIFVHIVDKL